LYFSDKKPDEKRNIFFSTFFSFVYEQLLSK